MTYSNRLLLWVFTLLLLFTSCDGWQMPEKLFAATTLEDIPESSWVKILKKRIFFGHQSIGLNIIDGIKDLIKKIHNIS